MWFKVTDRLSDDPAVEGAQERCPWAMSVWILTGTKSASPEVNSGGLLTADLLRSVRRRAALSTEQMAEAVDALVAEGLWHDAKSLRRCSTCAGTVKVPSGSYFVHAWWEANPPSEATVVPMEFRMWKLRDELKRDRKLCTLIDERDQGMCRYCAVLVKWSDKRGPNGGTRDHVDPYGGNAYLNVVVACRRCNGRKGHRTPEQWVAEEGLWSEDNETGGRPLLREPGPYQSAPGPDLVPDQNGTSPDSASRAHPARDGAGQDGTGSDPVQDQVGLGPDPERVGEHVHA